MGRVPVIYDGDMGADDLWAIAALLAHRDRFDILGMVSVFGNAPLLSATRNILNFLHCLRIEDIPVIRGSNTPYDGTHPFGDEAYGLDGIGGVHLPVAPTSPVSLDAMEWYNLQTDNYDGITIISTGPATNIARFLRACPSKTTKIKEIILMCGALRPPGRNHQPVLGKNGQIRKGNITPFAEFNAFQDPHALNIILESGVPCTIMSADATQNLVLTPERQARLLALDAPYASEFHRMMMAVDELDRSKFGVEGPFIHDPNTVIYALAPDLYKITTLPHLHFKESSPEDARRGEALTANTGLPVRWANGIEDEEAVFSLLLESLRKTLKRVS